MLGIHYGRIESNSVGYKEDYTMYSFDFEEFLWAKGYSDSFVEDLLKHMERLLPFNELELSVCRGLFLDFCILGGMPAVVRSMLKKGHLRDLCPCRDSCLQTMRRMSENMPRAGSGQDIECISPDSASACKGQ